ncbi:SEP-domain-containing protein [Metschnikowia bicuspidata var. bicuspidata NRRL YB-4993]|uniref:SEP-domain-containing protein n=1 Tax=Metschnikowia bicuspidata var. bicuspidata NRRL YB-4993 TaxID=869754 RepID=A0A1A0HKU0_9ASCO|nr:SEP-domain-containing protein [Metschnikowia bicuspidata var. bicuspidata NRRL YB-4993]OBA24423.1 SEP-domain-containing protein [Metschnikowia bicuspidata var. bicuspidata NRRL YB-4993]
MRENILHLVESFVAVTGASANLAQQYLARNDQDLTLAIEDFYSTSGPAAPAPRAGAATNRPPRAGGVRTLRDLGDAPDHDDRTDTNFFTGGEKSALQVENPDKHKHKHSSNAAQPSLVERIFQRASEQMNEDDDRPSAQAPAVPEQHFGGTGFRLGDSTQPLQAVEASHAPARPLKVNREITFWRQGFTVGDGPLRGYDDPEHVLLLNELKQGRVPVSLLDVEFGQDVDVSVVRKVDEDYVPPKRKLAGFQGLGQRLGSPVPGDEVPAPAQSKPAAAAGPHAPAGDGDLLVQIRFANGKRVAHRFPGLAPVSAVYLFVRGHEHTDVLRPFILSHTFPVKPIEDSAAHTVSLAQLKNAVIVQRWA